MEVSIPNSTQSSNSRNSSNSEIEKEISYLEISGDKEDNTSIVELNGSNNNNNNNNIINLSNGGSGGNEKINTLKKRISSGKTPTRKAKRVRFFRNGDKFYTGIQLPISNERYKYVLYFNYY